MNYNNTNTNTDAELSLCIPRVFANIDEKRVRSVIEQLLGKISRVDIIERTNEKGEKYKRVFVHFDHWFETADAQTAKSRLIEGKEIKIVYDDPWFWKVSANKVSVNTRPKQRINLQQPTAKPPPRLEFDESRGEPQYPANNRPYNQRDYRQQDPRNYRQQDPRNYRQQEPMDYRQQDPRNYRQQEPRNYRQQEPMNYRQQEPRDYRQQEPRDYRQPIALALQFTNPTMESKPATVAVTAPVKEPKVKEPKVKEPKTKYKKESKPKSKIVIKLEPEDGEEAAATSAAASAVEEHFAETVTTESQEQK